MEHRLREINSSEQKEISLIEFCRILFPVNRSLSGQGVRDTLKYLNLFIRDFKIKKIRSEKKIYDWNVPLEWKIESAHIKDSAGNKIIDMSDSNLHVVGYSEPINQELTKEELFRHLHFIEDYPNAIPYVTSYYKKTWGFCVQFDKLDLFINEPFTVEINSKLFKGFLNYGETTIKGKSKKEIVFSTNICHPSMANNELSGPAVLVGLLSEVQNSINLRHTYTFLFLPETIGSLIYIKRNFRRLKKIMLAGFVVTCVGDGAPFSYIPSRNGNTYSDKIAKFALRDKDFINYTWLDRGSDERQFCSPGVDLPFCSVTRSKYREYKEYQTSEDNLHFISNEALNESLQYYLDVIYIIENNVKLVSIQKGEPNLGKRNLYSTLSKRGSTESSLEYLNVLSYCDGSYDLIDISLNCDLNFKKTVSIAELLLELKLVRILEK